MLVRERESMKTQATEDWRDFAGSSQLSILRKEAYALHITRMQRVRPDGDSCVSPNLIVMLFNLLYPVFIVGFQCKGCLLERESMKT